MSLQRTPYDLNWRMFGIPVRVHPTFWLVSAVFAWPHADRGIAFWLVGIACMFVSLMAHELGHALMFRCYHMDSGILLYSFGGLTIPDGRLPQRSWRIIVTLAGPFANFLLLGIVWGSNYVEPWARKNEYLWVVYWIMFSINLYWGLLNLLPVFPLDGGQISRELWLKYRPDSGLVNSLQMSFLFAIGFAAYAIGCHYNLIPPDWLIPWLRPGIFAGILFIILAVENYSQLQAAKRSRVYYDDRTPWER